MPTKAIVKKAKAKPAVKKSSTRSATPAKPAAKKVAAKAKPTKVPGSKSNANNERLRELVERLGITQEEALKRFNVGFGIKSMSMNAWKSYFVRAEASARHRHFGDVLLAHAEKKLG